MKILKVALICSIALAVSACTSKEQIRQRTLAQIDQANIEAIKVATVIGKNQDGKSIFKTKIKELCDTCYTPSSVTEKIVYFLEGETFPRRYYVPVAVNEESIFTFYK